MEYIRLGKSELNVSRLCLGVMSYGAKSWRPWVLTEEEGRPFIRHALALGITFFDTADIYSKGVSEEILGRAIKDFTQRENVVIATKVFYPMSDDPGDRGLSRRHILDSVDKSLKRLGTDYIDLYQIHRFDSHTPIEETMGALHEIITAGKVRYIGASSMFTYQFAKMQHVADMNRWPRFVSMQNHYNLVYREEEREMIPYCREEGVAIIPWSPLARGFLTGSRRRGSQDATVREQSDQYAKDMYYQESDYRIVDRVIELARRNGVKPAQVALAWLLHKGITAPIIGATKPHHLDDAAAAVSIKLSEEDIRRLEELYQPHPVLGFS